jgi:AcrR family transcriptional regulator
MVQVMSAQRTRLRRAEILAAASEVFRAKGFHAAGMRDIAAHLDVAVGKLYYWFPSKEALLAYCQEDCLARLLAMVAAAEAQHAQAVDSLRAIIHGHLHCLNTESPGSLAHLETESLGSKDRPRILRQRRRYEEAVAAVVARGVRAGDFAAVDARVSACVLLGALNWTVKWWRPDGRLGLEALAATMADQLVDGIRVRPVRASRRRK